MGQRGGRTLALIVGSAILGSIATMIINDSSQEQTQQTQLNRKTDPRVPPKPAWKNVPESLRKEERSAQEPTENKQALAKINTPLPQSRNRKERITLDNPPKAAQLRDEAQLDAHGTPRALLDFAEELAQSMEGAFANPDNRYQVSRQLIACARDSESKGSAQAARALCLANLERLKNKYPNELSASYLSLIAELPDDLVFVAGVQTTPSTEKQ